MFWFFLGLGIVAFVIFIMRLYEHIWNQRLHKKQVVLRVKQNILKSGIWSKLGLPIVTSAASLVFAIIFFGGSGIVLNPTDVHALTSKSDLLQLIASYKEQSNDYYFYSPKSSDYMALDAAEYTTDVGSSDHSETNVQVVGVDEADTALTDGTYVYSISQNRIMISRIFDPSSPDDLTVDLALVKEIDYLDYGEDENDYYHFEQAFAMYVDDDYLVVLAHNYDYNGDYTWYPDSAEPGMVDSYYYYYSSVQQTTAYVYDKTDNFSLLNTYRFDGDYVGTRKIDHNLFIITTQWIYDNTIEERPADDIIPEYEKDDVVYKEDYSDVRYIDGTAPTQFMNIYGLNLDTTDVDQTTFLGGGYQLYVSTNNIYITQSKWDYSAVSIMAESTDYTVSTEIMKISMDGYSTQLQAVGSVPGTVNNQFSMDESNGYFRIATTDGSWWNQTGNHLFVLDNDLQVVGKVTNLAPGERIQSVRFIGDYAYIVTFRQTDPLFTINVTDPTNPIVMDELKISGYSSYLHPYGDGLLIGLGFEANESGDITGLKVALFDVSDPENAVLIDKEVILYQQFSDNFGWAWTSATFNHLDLLINKEKGIIGFPLEFTNYNSSDNRYEYHEGFLLYNIHTDSDDVFTLNGFMQHDFPLKEVDPNSPNLDRSEYYYYYNYSNKIYKGMFVDQYLITVSEAGVVASDLTNSETIVDSLPFPQK